MDRIVIIGTSCSGKTTLARKLSEILHIPHIELDTLFWKKNWQIEKRNRFREKVSRVVKKNQWVIDGNFSIVRDLVWKRADTIIWLDYPFHVIFTQALIRSIKRIITKEKLFADNVESIKQTFFSKNSILYWIIVSHWDYKRTYTRLLRHSKKEVIILKSTREKNEFVRRLES
ncbi:MAG: AAA family ATPase [Candidatus Cloacimonetes bacterium]|nr:AAA family ATPase [Candidatus Cloacimonadota bacterium]